SINQIANNIGITLEQAKSLFNMMIYQWTDQKLFLSSDVQFKSVIANFLRSKDYAPGMLGYKIGEDSELRSLIIRSFLEVPELRYNRVDITIGDKWNAPCGGIIESVDTVNQIVTLKLEKGEIGSIAIDDICMGIYHSLDPLDNSTITEDDGRGNRKIAGFATVYFRITEIIDDRKRFKYVLRGVSDRWKSTIHPMPMMHFVGYGNFINKARQTSNYSTRTYTRYLRNVSDWEFTAYNIAAQFGDLDNLSVFGIDMKGYSMYLDNIYMSGKIDQSAYLPDRMEFDLSNGYSLSLGEETIVTPYLYNGWDDVSLKYDRFIWTRDSGNTSEDASWNILHQASQRSLTIKFSDLNINRVIFSCEASKIGFKITGNIIV
ncbi:MAG: hypothetical protein RR705_01985, partial [Lachnospiraceae bacterium]